VYLGYALTTFVIAMLPVCFARPWIGVLMWCWLGYMTPHRLTWGPTHNMPFAMMVAIATLLGLVFTGDRRPVPRTEETYLLLALWTVFTLSTMLALYQDFAWDQWVKVSKILLFTFIPLLLFQDKKRFRYLLLVVALSLGFYGFKGGIWTLARGGSGRVQMPDDSMFGDTNGAGLAFVTVLPMLLYLGREEQNIWLRRLLRVTFVLTIPATLFTYSRGAVVGLAAIVLALAGKANRFLSAAVGLTALYIFVINFAPPEWFERMQTVREYERDGSAMSRLDAWYIAWRFALDRPFLGGGFWSVGQPEIVERYMPGRGFQVSSHSIFFSVLGEHGFIGLALFLGLLGSCIWTLRRLRHQNVPPPPSWVRSYSHMLEVSIVGFVVTGAFLNAAYIDLLYHLVAFVILLKVLAEREASEQLAQAAPPTTVTADAS